MPLTVNAELTIRGCQAVCVVGLSIKLAPGTLGTVSAAHARKWYSFLDDFDQKSPMWRVVEYTTQ